MAGQEPLKLLMKVRFLPPQQKFAVSGKENMENLDKQKTDFFNEELHKIRNTLSERNESIGSLLALSGLLSFLPALNLSGDYFSNFLIWTFPFIIVAIFVFYRASWRVTSVIKGLGFATEGTDVALEILKNRVSYLDLVWRKSLDNHDVVMKLYSWTQSLIYAYIVSAIVNLYLFVFYGEPCLLVSLIITVLSCLVGVILYLWPKSQSEKNRVIGS